MAGDGEEGGRRRGSRGLATAHRLAKSNTLDHIGQDARRVDVVSALLGTGSCVCCEVAVQLSPAMSKFSSFYRFPSF